MNFDTEKCKIISGGNKNRFDAYKNHEIYCKYWNTEYEFYLDSKRQPPYFIKIDAILDSFKKYDYVLYLDDDAFFLDRQWNYSNVFLNYSEYNLIVTAGYRGYFNSGVMFLKKSNRLIDLLNKVERINRNNYLNDWDFKSWGNPGQDYDNARLVYLTQRYLKDKTKIVDYPGFNCKELHFSKGYSSPIVHFTSRNKQGKMNRFERKHQSLYDI